MNTSAAQTILLNPGPVNVSPRVTQALLRGDLCHREPEFSILQNRVRDLLCRAFASPSEYTAVLLTGSGTAALEAAVASSLHPQRKMLVINNGVYGERMQGKPTARNFDFGETVTEIVATNEGVPTVLPVLPQSWRYFWRHGQWNELRARIVGNPPTVTTWINGVKFMELTDTEKRLPDTGGIALQVHGGGDSTKQFVRYRNIRVKPLD